MATAKEELGQLIAQQPDDSSYEELVRELAFSVMVRRGLNDSDAGCTIANEEMRLQIAALRDQVQKLEFALEVAQTDEVIWSQYAAASMSDGDVPAQASEMADSMLNHHHARWPRG